MNLNSTLQMALAPLCSTQYLGFCRASISFIRKRERARKNFYDDVSLAIIYAAKVFFRFESKIIFTLKLIQIFGCCLKVSRSRKKIVELELLPKTNELFWFSILTVRKYSKLENRNSSFKDFRTVRTEKQIRLFVFWEKLWLDNFVSRSTDLQV